MKRILLAILILSFAGNLSAQGTFVSKILEWQAPLVDSSHEAADDYAVYMNGTLLGVVTATEIPVSIPLGSTTVFIVIARNYWGQAQSSLTIRVNAPNSPNGLKIR